MWKNRHGGWNKPWPECVDQVKEEAMPADLGDMLIAMPPRLSRHGLALARNGDIADELVQATCERPGKACRRA